MELKLIPSFQIDHTKLQKGLYISRVDDDIVTYDIRVKRPNLGDYLTNGVLHTIEHLFATYARSSEYADHIIYFGPMGCRTGFYFLVKALDGKKVIELTTKAFQYIAGFEGKIPGRAPEECGNWLEHDLEGAKKESLQYLEVLKGYKTQNGYRDDLLSYSVQR